ncbi:MAG: hypothetical protein M3442_17735 [Chloroflexota bacterium]|nr:hypothetical protein [Chloroflexota bacterium]
MVLAGLAIWLLLLALAVLLLVGGIFLLILAPLLASRVASTTTRPRLERRASGPDRMRALINSQRSARRKRSSLATALKRSGVALVGMSVLSLVGAGVLAVLGL